MQDGNDVEGYRGEPVADAVAARVADHPSRAWVAWADGKIGWLELAPHPEKSGTWVASPPDGATLWVGPGDHLIVDPHDEGMESVVFDRVWAKEVTLTP